MTRFPNDQVLRAKYQLSEAADSALTIFYCSSHSRESHEQELERHLRQAAQLLGFDLVPLPAEAAEEQKAA